MKFIIFLWLPFLLLPNPGISGTILTKTDLLNKTNECLRESQKKGCKKLILHMEKMQIVEFERNRFKCQSSILGLQTELLEVYFFKKAPKRLNAISIPYVIKNC